MCRLGTVISLRSHVDFNHRQYPLSSIFYRRLIMNHPGIARSLVARETRCERGFKRGMRDRDAPQVARMHVRFSRGSPCSARRVGPSVGHCHSVELHLARGVQFLPPTRDTKPREIENPPRADRRSNFPARPRAIARALVRKNHPPIRFNSSSILVEAINCSTVQPFSLLLSTATLRCAASLSSIVGSIVRVHVDPTTAPLNHFRRCHARDVAVCRDHPPRCLASCCSLIVKFSPRESRASRSCFFFSFLFLCLSFFASRNIGAYYWKLKITGR